MSVIIPMNAVATLFEGVAAPNIPTKIWGAVRYRILSQSSHGTANAGRLAKYGQINVATGVQWLSNLAGGVQSAAVAVRTASSAAVGNTTPSTVGTWYTTVVSYDLAGGVLRKYVNKTLLEENLATGAQTFHGGNPVPSIQGWISDARVLELSHFYVGHNGVLTESEIQNFEFGVTDLQALEDPPTFGIAPVGYQGDFVTTLEDLVGSNDLVLKAGAITEEDPNHPYISGPPRNLFFISSSKGVNFFKPKMEITAEGTLYSVVGLASANTTDPTAQQVKEGKNQDGTAALVADDFEIEEPVAEQELQISPLSPLTSYKWSAVLETVEEGLGNTIHQTFSTTSAERVDGPFYADIVTDNRIAGILQNICKRLNELET